jgi:putative tryptophan/tyrosine transport system substrate-binding protein
MPVLPLPRRLLALAVGAVLLGLAAAAAAAREPEIAKLAILGPAEEPRFSQIAEGFRRGLRDHGYPDGSIDTVEQKIARGDQSAARRAVEEIVRRRVAVVLVIGSELARIVRETAPELQVVFVTPGDPVGAGLAASLARPGGNATAITFEFPELSGKRLELLKSLNPNIRRVLVFYDPRDASPRQGLEHAREAAHTLGIGLVEREVRDKTELDRGLQALSDVDGFVAIPGGAPSAYYGDIVRAANARKIATFFPSRTSSTRDALASYGARDADVARDAARLADKIIKGQRAGDLPIERPTRLEFSINLKTAKAIGIEVPSILAARADEIIE